MTPCPVCGAGGGSCGRPSRAVAVDADLWSDATVLMHSGRRAPALWTSDRRLYLDAAGKVVEAADPTRRMLLVGAGGTLPMERAVELGLVVPATAAPVVTEERHETDPTTPTEPAPPRSRRKRLKDSP